MKRSLTIGIVCSLLVLTVSCDTVTFTPRSHRQKQREKPSVVLLTAITEFRIEQNSWPVSKEDFTSKGKKYYDAFVGFPYLYTRFNVTDSNTMVFDFSDHIKDRENYNQTKKIDLGDYSGTVKFYKEHGKFVWKLTMR